ncbi:response regulator transcription factor [Spirosoma aureum]|uniref:Response regulator transcription factor n=1 Tax=Spirosoma aureum TaxID=2692134 RepID=A0A6G9AKK2_9BACT|nr:LuxR C-terminal-related transcriptional regulator [Spirosoma aureum]QIP12978.1 response regulator transcription factor [Spirosoma aureum]
MQSILIAHGQCVSRIGFDVLIKELLGSSVNVVFVEDGKGIMALLEHKMPCMLIIDAHLPKSNVLTTVMAILRSHPVLRILMTSSSPDDVMATNFFKLGVLAFVYMGSTCDEFRSAILNVFKGKRHFSESQSEMLLHGMIENGNSNPFQRLSIRELEVCHLLLLGYGPMGVADALSINASTASTYKRRVFEKLGIKNILELNRLAGLFEVILSG